MTLKKFIENFVEPNTLIRLWNKTEDNGHAEVIGEDEPQMEHDLVKSQFKDKNVVGVTDILYLGSHYAEAVNIIIEN